MAVTVIPQGSLPTCRKSLLVLLFLAIPGCVSLTEWTSLKSAAPTGPVHQVHSVWEPFIASAPDPINHGRPVYGLAGRVFLFGPNMGFPLRGEGKIEVALADLSKGKEEPVDGWSFEKATLQKLFREDGIGWGYTLFLASDKYRPDMTRLRVKIRYVPESGIPVYSTPTTITLRNEGRPFIQEQTILPAGAKK